MNIDCRQLLSRKGRVSHMPKLQAQQALCNLVLLYLCRLTATTPSTAGPRQSEEVFNH